MTEDQVKYNPYVVDERSCATCGRIRPDDPACPMSSLDIDTCLGNPSRPFWRPRAGDMETARAFTNQMSPKEDVSSSEKWLCKDCIFEDVHLVASPCYTCQPGEKHGSKFQPKYQPDTQDFIRDECDSIREMLMEKNRKYGDSAIDPVRIFSSADPVAQIDVRIDDKLSRIRSAQNDDTEDAELDLIGYLILKRVAKRAGK